MSDLSHPLNPIAGALSGHSDGSVLWPAPLEGGYPAWAHREGGVPCIVESRIGRRYGGQLTALDLGGQVALLRSNRGPQVITLRFDQLRSLTLGERLSPHAPDAPRPSTRPLVLGNARGVQLRCEALSPLAMGGGVFVYQPVDASARLQCSFHPDLQVLDEPADAPSDAADTLPAALLITPGTAPSAPAMAITTATDRTAAPDSVGTAEVTARGATDTSDSASASASPAADDTVATAGAAVATTHEARETREAHTIDADTDAAPPPPVRRTVVAPLAALVERAHQAGQAAQSGPALRTGPLVTGHTTRAEPSGTRQPPISPATTVEPAATSPTAVAAPPLAPTPAASRRPSGREPTLTDVLPADTLPAARLDTLAAARGAADSLLAEAPTLPMSFDLGGPAQEPSVLHDATLPMPLDERPDARATRADADASLEPVPGVRIPPVRTPAAAAGRTSASTMPPPDAPPALRLPRLDTDLQLGLGELGAAPSDPTAAEAPACPPAAAEPAVQEAGPPPASRADATAEPPPAVQDLATLHARLDAPSAPAMRLGEALMALGALSEAQLGDALQAQARGPGLALGELLLREGIIDRATLRTALTCKLGYVAVDLRTLTPQDDALQVLSAALCRQHRALPLCWHGDALVVALDDPSARIAVDRLEQLAQAPVRAVACDGDLLDEALAALVDPAGRRAPTGELRGRLPALSAPSASTAAAPDASDAPAGADRHTGSLDEVRTRTGTGTALPRDPDTGHETDSGRSAMATLDPDDEDLLADRLIAAALDAQADDLHIHCESRGVALQLRQAGALRPWHSLPAAAAAPLMRRLHQLAGIDEPRPATPATHGRIALSRCLPGQRGEARLQTLRRADGGRDGVLRLPAAAPRSGLAALGLCPAMQDDLRQALGRPGGLLLRVGAPGSGRRTGVRAMLAELASPHRRLWQSLDEDQDSAAERAGLRQVRLRPQQGWSAESALKALAHADADVVAIEGLDAPADLLAALQLARATPTRVLGTLGAADALDALARLQAAGAPGWALADGLRGLWSTRLLPRCCPACRQARPAGPEWEQALLRLWSEDATRGEAGAETQLRRWRTDHGRDGQLLQWEAPGCARCEGRGTEGWVGVHELLLPGAGLRQALREGQSPGSWWSTARADGWQPMRRDLLLKLLGGQIGADAIHACG